MPARDGPHVKFVSPAGRGRVLLQRCREAQKIEKYLDVFIKGMQMEDRNSWWPIFSQVADDLCLLIFFHEFTVFEETLQL